MAVNTPDFNFSTFYYQEILAELEKYTRENVPEITDYNPHEPFMQLLRAFALVGHINNTHLDMVALETFLPTAQLLQSVIQHGQLMGYRLKAASASSVDLMAELTQVFATRTTIVPVRSQFSTEPASGEEPIIFENLSPVVIEPTEQLSSIFLIEADNKPKEITAEITNPAVNSKLWSTPKGNDKLYIGHASVTFDTLTIGIDQPYDVQPDSVVFNEGDLENVGDAQLELTINSLLGVTPRPDSCVIVTYLPNGVSDTFQSEINQNKVIITSGNGKFLGQIYKKRDIDVEPPKVPEPGQKPSENPADYSVSFKSKITGKWQYFAGIDKNNDEEIWIDITTVNGKDETQVDGASFSKSGQVSFTLPQKLQKKWEKHSIKVGTEQLLNRFWLRFVLNDDVDASVSQPEINHIHFRDGKQYLQFPVYQGETIEEILASSTGEANQEYTLRQRPFIDGSLSLQVKEVADFESWALRDSLFSSGSLDKHYTIEVDAEDRVTVRFGDGIHGKIPTAGVDNIRAVYRIGANRNGNVGAKTIAVNSSGVPYLGEIFNPLQAAGWRAKDGATPASLEAAKADITASMRVRQRAVTAKDCEFLAENFSNRASSSPVARALANEEGFGLKTIEIVTVGEGGGQLSQTDKAGLESFFNDTETGVMLVNHRAVVRPFEPLKIKVTATISGSSAVEINKLLGNLLNPITKAEDGFNWRWQFGQKIPKSVIIAEVHRIVDVLEVVTLRLEGITSTGESRSPTSISGDLALELRELPVFDEESVITIS